MRNYGGSDGSSGAKLEQPGGEMVVEELGEWKRALGSTYRIKRWFKRCSKSTAIKELISFRSWSRKFGRG